MQKVILIVGFIVAFIFCVAIVINLGLSLYRKYEKLGNNAFKRLLKELNLKREKDNENNTYLIFHVYVGLEATLRVLFIRVKATKVEGYVPESEALLVLKKMRNFNFKWGLLGPGGFFVLFLTLWNYYVQKKILMNDKKKSKV